MRTVSEAHTFVVTRPWTGLSSRAGTGGLMWSFGRVGGPAAGGGALVKSRPATDSGFNSPPRTWRQARFSLA